MTAVLLSVLVLICTLHSVSMYYYYDQYYGYDDYEDYPLRRMNRRAVRYSRRAPFHQRPPRKIVHSNIKEVKLNPNKTRRRVVTPTQIIMQAVSKSKRNRHRSGSRRHQKTAEITEIQSTEVEFPQFRRNLPIYQQNQDQTEILNAISDNSDESDVQYAPNQPNLQFRQRFPPMPGLFNLNQPGMQFGPGMSPLQSGLQYVQMQNGLNQAERHFSPKELSLQNNQSQSVIQEIRNENIKSLITDPLANLDYNEHDAQNPNEPEELFDSEHILVQNIQDVPHEDNLNLSDIPIDINMTSEQLMQEHQENLSNLTRIEVQLDRHNNNNISFLSSVNVNVNDLAPNETQMSTIEMTVTSTSSSVLSELLSERSGNSRNVNNTTTPETLSTTNGTNTSIPWQNITQVFIQTTLVPENPDVIYNKLREDQGLFSVFLETALTYLLSKPDQIVKLLIDQIKPAVTSLTTDPAVFAVIPPHILNKAIELSHYISTVPVEELRLICHTAAETMKIRRKNVSSDLNAIIDAVDSMYNEQTYQLNMVEDLKKLRDFPQTNRSAYALTLDIINNIVLNPFLRSNQHQRQMLADSLNMYVLYYNYIRNNVSFSSQSSNLEAFDEKSNRYTDSFKQAAYSQENLKQTVVNNDKSLISTVSVDQKSSVAYFLKEDNHHSYVVLEQTTHRNLYFKKEENKKFPPDIKAFGFKDLFKRKEFAKSPTIENLKITTEETLNEIEKSTTQKKIFYRSLNQKLKKPSKRLRKYSNEKALESDISQVSTFERNLESSFNDEKTLFTYKTNKKFTKKTMSPSKLLISKQKEIRDYDKNINLNNLSKSHRKRKKKQSLDRYKPSIDSLEITSEVNSNDVNSFLKFQQYEEATYHSSAPLKLLTHKRKETKRVKNNFKFNKHSNGFRVKKKKQTRFKQRANELELSSKRFSKSRREKKKKESLDRSKPSIDSLEMTSEGSFNDVNTFSRFQQYDETSPHEDTSHSLAPLKLHNERKEHKKNKNSRTSNKLSSGQKVKKKIQVHSKPRVDELEYSIKPSKFRKEKNIKKSHNRHTDTLAKISQEYNNKMKTSQNKRKTQVKQPGDSHEIDFDVSASKAKIPPVYQDEEVTTHKGIIKSLSPSIQLTKEKFIVNNQKKMTKIPKVVKITHETTELENKTKVFIKKQNKPQIISKKIENALEFLGYEINKDIVVFTNSSETSSSYTTGDKNKINSLTRKTQYADSFTTTKLKPHLKQQKSQGKNGNNVNKSNEKNIRPQKQIQSKYLIQEGIEELINASTEHKPYKDKIKNIEMEERAKNKMKIKTPYDEVITNKAKQSVARLESADYFKNHSVHLKKKAKLIISNKNTDMIRGMQEKIKELGFHLRNNSKFVQSLVHSLRSADLKHKIANTSLVLKTIITNFNEIKTNRTKNKHNNEVSKNFVIKQLKHAENNHETEKSNSKILNKRSLINNNKRKHVNGSTKTLFKNRFKKETTSPHVVKQKNNINPSASSETLKD